MDDTRAHPTLAATAALLLDEAGDPMDAVDALLEGHGFDRAFQALASLESERAAQALWAALCCLVFDEAVD